MGRKRNLWPVFLGDSDRKRKVQMKFSTSLKKNEDFRYVYRNGKVRANRYLVMYVVENNRAINRLGISASKKIGNSVVRHHFYRLVRESYRLHEKIFNSGLDIVVVAKRAPQISVFGTSRVRCCILQNCIISYRQRI